MTAPATPLRPTQTHPCARCGSPVALDVGLCERCNPLGLKDSASSQVHGTVFIAVALAVIGLAFGALLLTAGIGPFVARVSAMRPAQTGTGLVATIEVRNDGRSTGSATCRLSDPNDTALVSSAVIYTPRIQPGATATFEQEVPFGSVDRMLSITCGRP